MAYMAPEQITGKSPITRKTDLYALGCVLFEMLTGRTPFQAETQPELLFKHVEEDPPSVREYNVDVPLWLEQLIDELLAKEPEERPFDALAVQVKLEEVKTKVAKQESIIGQTVAGGGSALTMRDGDPALTKVLGSKKKKRKKKKVDHSPFYEQTWFMGLGLLVVIALIAWAAWPESEDTIFARIEPVMASDNPDDWLRSDAEDDLKAGRPLPGRDACGEVAEVARRHRTGTQCARAENADAEPTVRTRDGRRASADSGQGV